MAHRGRHSADSALAARLAAGATVRDAARDAGVSEKTAHRRNADPTFQARVLALRGQMVHTAAGQLADGMGAAAGVLRALLAHDDPHVRHKAAVKLIELGVKVAELTDLEARVRRLEGPVYVDEVIVTAGGRP